MRPGAHCLIFMDQKEVASGDCCIILGGKEGVSTIVSNSEKKVWLLLKRLESFIHLQIGEHEKSLPRVEILWSFRFPLHLELVARSIQPSVGSCARFYDPHSSTPPAYTFTPSEKSNKTHLLHLECESKSD